MMKVATVRALPCCGPVHHLRRLQLQTQHSKPCIVLPRPSRRFTCITKAFKREDETNDTFYPGVYGPWKIEEKDVFEVWTYRISITVVSLSLALGTADMFLSGGGTEAGTVFAVLGASGLGVGLALIHIYITQLKRLLQAFWLAGIVGGVWLLVGNPDTPLPSYVVEHRESVWLIGPLFAALTGLTFKEGVCYGKPEAFALTLLIPIWLLGHLTGWAPGSLEKGLALTITTLLLVFAARKYTQPLKDDIGDGSVFKFQKLQPDEQAAFLTKLRNEGEILK